jgi:metal-sulfur cluster biosynthetic enzyme
MDLIYEIDPGSPVKIVMTYTTPFCPWGPDLEKEIKEKLSAAGMTDPVITITFDPPYHMPDELRASLGI